MKWSQRKYWFHWLKMDIQKFFYKNVFGLDVTFLPQTGKGKFVSVFLKGKIIQIKSESNRIVEFDEIRIIPYQPNHGVMVESLKDGKLYSRNILDIDQLQKNIIFATNVEQLCQVKTSKKE